jgi:uncharacterized protein involved in exopolysaccharide biosynthesis
MRKEEIAIPEVSGNGFDRKPISHPVVLPALEKEAALSGPSLSQYLWMVKRHRWKLVAFVAFSVVATVIVSKRLTPLYESTAVIDIDRQTPAAVLGDESRAANNSADVENFLTTQEQIVQSDAVLRPVVEKYHLTSPALRKAGKK